MFVVMLCLLAVTCSRQPTAPSAADAGGGSLAAKPDDAGNTPLSATMRFGQTNVGSPTPPGSTHDQSAHAKDNIVPRDVVIDAGGTVKFEVPPGVHQIAIYKPGTEPGDINTNLRTTLAAFANCAGDPVVNAPLVINDPANLEKAIPVPCFTPTTKSYTFKTAGRYLVICAFFPHFNVGMWGWVTVRD
jgi:plastocyanin